MKKQILSYFAVAALVLLCSAPMAFAQSLDKFLTMQIPFDFQIKGKTLPAGTYAFKRNRTMPEVLIIQGSDRSPVIAFTVFGSSAMSPQFSLTFHEYGEQRFLASVQSAPSDYLFLLVKSKAERALAQTIPVRIIRLISTDNPSRTNHTNENNSRY